MAGHALEQAEARHPGQADGAVTRIVMKDPQATTRRGEPDRPFRGHLRDRAQEGARARRRRARRRGRARPGSPGPRGTRAASATAAGPVARPRTSPSASTSTASAPTASPSRLRSCTPARADRIAGPEVDVGRPAPERLAVERLGQQVDPAVDAAARRERLEPKAVVGAGRDRIGQFEDPAEHRRRDVEPRPRDVAERQQQVGGHDRQQQPAAEELRVGRRTARCRQPQPAPLTLADDRRRERVAIRLLEDRRRQCHRRVVPRAMARREMAGAATAQSSSSSSKSGQAAMSTPWFSGDASVHQWGTCVPSARRPPASSAAATLASA